MGRARSKREIINLWKNAKRELSLPSSTLGVPPRVTSYSVLKIMFKIFLTLFIVGVVINHTVLTQIGAVGVVIFAIGWLIAV